MSQCVFDSTYNLQDPRESQATYAFFFPGPKKGERDSKITVAIWITVAP